MKLFRESRFSFTIKNLSWGSVIQKILECIIPVFQFQKTFDIKMDSDNAFQVIYSNFGPSRDTDIQESNSESMQEVGDYFKSNPSTPVRNIETPIKASDIVSVAMNLSDVFETIEVVEENTIVLESSSIVITDDKANEDDMSREQEGSPRSSQSNIVKIDTVCGVTDGEFTINIEKDTKALYNFRESQ